MQIVNHLLEDISGENVFRGMFSNLYIGASKDVCFRCAEVLDFLGIRHRPAHTNRVEVQHWTLPEKLEEGSKLSDIYETSNPNDDFEYVL